MKREPFDLQPGRTLGPHYRILEYLGGGWEGEVYKIEERRTGIIRAAKLFYRRDGLRREPLLRYARKLYQLRECPIIVQYHHRGTVRIGKKQVDFLVSDFADGELLSSYIARQKGNKLTEFEALHLFYALALGVEQIHFRGEYHGDIHSDNIMVKRRGLGFDIYLVDFFDLGRATKQRIQEDIYDMIAVLYELIGEGNGYRKCGDQLHQIICNRRHDLIRKKFKNAGDVRIFLENMGWD